MATQERREFADLLEGLTDQQWNARSLCRQWRVRNVAAHVIAYLDRSQAEFAATLIKHRLHLDQLNAADVRGFAVPSSQCITRSMRGVITPRSVGAGFAGRITLVECMIHQQDIRDPLNLPRTIPADRLLVALNFTRMAPLIRGGWTTRGVRLIATDLDWSAGHGPEVHGTAKALLMTMAQRPSALANLTGPGVAILVRRLPQTR